MGNTLLKTGWPFLWKRDHWLLAAEEAASPRRRSRTSHPTVGATISEASAAAWTEFGTADAGAALSATGTSVYMTATLNGTTEVQSERIVITGFGLRIPQNSVASKIEVRYAIRSSSTAGYDSEVFLTKDGSAPASANLAEREAAAAAFATVVRTDGALGGVTWTPQELNDDTFGAIIRVASAVSDQIDLNSFRVTVYYEPALVPMVSGGRTHRPGRRAAGRR